MRDGRGAGEALTPFFAPLPGASGSTHEFLTATVANSEFRLSLTESATSHSSNRNKTRLSGIGGLQKATSKAGNAPSFIERRERRRQSLAPRSTLFSVHAARGCFLVGASRTRDRDAKGAEAPTPYCSVRRAVEAGARSEEPGWRI